ncbi:MAG: hypothetical protein AB1730_03950 [Myxococcota bacterium]|jgi:hypothetical protein
MALLCSVGAGCRDAEAERFARAKLRYEALLEQHARADAKDFEQVLADLDAVSKGSPHSDEAQRLAKAIRLARGPTVRTPLALAPREGSRPPELEAALNACARLAQLAGADGGVDRRALEALEACRHRAEVLELHLSHGHDAPDGGALP